MKAATDLIKHLKSAVSESIKRDEALKQGLVAAEDQINGRLRSLAEDLGTWP